MQCPAEVYQPSPRPYTGLPDIDYPFHDKTIVVTRCATTGKNMHPTRCWMTNRLTQFKSNGHRSNFSMEIW
jgi:hypothetical protein